METQFFYILWFQFGVILFFYVVNKEILRFEVRLLLYLQMLQKLINGRNYHVNSLKSNVIISVSLAAD